MQKPLCAWGQRSLSSMLPEHRPILEHREECEQALARSTCCSSFLSVLAAFYMSLPYVDKAVSIRFCLC